MFVSIFKSMIVINSLTKSKINQNQNQKLNVENRTTKIVVFADRWSLFGGKWLLAQV